MIISRAIVWLGRCCHSRGFGVQSPSDYRFVRYVINEHYPYYAYDDIRKRFPKAKWKENKIGRLLFRIANFVQPSLVTLINPASSLYPVYIQSGCRKSEICYRLPVDKCIDMIVLNAATCSQDALDLYSQQMHESSIMIVEGIYSNCKARAFWNKVKENSNAVVTFDLYYAGVVMFDKKRYRQHYKINF